MNKYLNPHPTRAKTKRRYAGKSYLAYRKKLKVFLDDEREAPEGWVRVYWPDEAIKLLKQGNVIEISLDHDLGDDVRGTGYDVILWLEDRVINHKFKPPVVSVHSANVSARYKMEQGIQSIIYHSKK